ncbi:TfoX/Sxy family protein [Dyadobacter sp. BHUBP1]|uniref:TfoX/Sxy family protein n=1 Tax=Dyadobacter sp. BHUBP1 TaxID=3424178 RepID=UPI003D335C67
MAFNETLSDRIREALSEQENVIEKRMFGGVCFMVNDKMCVGVIGEDMMCRVGEEAFDSAIERPGCREMDFASRPMKGYVYVSDEGMRTREDFQYWINLCMAYNPQAKASKKKKAIKKYKSAPNNT